MNGLISFLTLLSWYKDRKPRKYDSIKSLIKKLVLSVKHISKELEELLADKNSDPIEIEILYNMLFNSDEESELIYAINEFLKHVKELEIFSEQEIKEFEEILRDFKITIAIVANVYNNLKSGGKREYISINELWKESE